MEHLGWGLQMTVLGMGLVFALLALLWLLLTIVLKLDREETEEPKEAVSVPAAGESGETVREKPAAPARTVVDGMESDLVAAIFVAVHKHRHTLRRQAAPTMRAEPHDSPWLAAGRARQTHDWQPRGR